MEEDHYEEFMRAVPGEELTMILRVHLLTEYFLERVIVLSLPFGERLLKDSRFTYVQKLSLVRSFGMLRDDLHCGLKKLNKVRNDCAHVRNREITEKDLDSIGQCLGENYRDVLKRDNREFRHRLVDVLGMLSAGLSALIEAQEKRQKNT